MGSASLRERERETLRNSASRLSDVRSREGTDASLPHEIPEVPIKNQGDIAKPPEPGGLAGRVAPHQSRKGRGSNGFTSNLGVPIDSTVHDTSPKMQRGPDMTPEPRRFQFKS